MAAPKNTITRSVAPKSIFEDASAVTSTTEDYNQGDLMVFDTSAKTVIKATNEASGANFLGVAIETVVDGKLKKPYVTDVDASSAITALPGPVYCVVAKCILKTGSTLTAGQLVYLDPVTSTRGVQPTGTKAIGVYQGAALSGSAAGLEVEVLLGARYPSDTLLF